VHRRRQANLRRERRIAQSRSKHDARRVDRPGRGCQREAAACARHIAHRTFADNDSTAHNEGGMQCPQQSQRVDLAIRRTVRRPCDVGTDARQKFRQRIAIQHLHPIRRGVACDERGALDQFAFGQAQVHAPALLEGDVDARFFAQAGGQFRPALRGCSRPGRVGRKVYALTLHPNEAKVAARGAKCAIAFVEHGDAARPFGKPVGDRGTDQPTANDHEVEGSRLHAALTPAKRRIAGICASKSWNAWSPPPYTNCHAPR